MSRKIMSHTPLDFFSAFINTVSPSKYSSRGIYNTCLISYIYSSQDINSHAKYSFDIVQRIKQKKIRARALKAAQKLTIKYLHVQNPKLLVLLVTILLSHLNYPLKIKITAMHNSLSVITFKHIFFIISAS